MNEYRIDNNTTLQSFIAVWCLLFPDSASASNRSVTDYKLAVAMLLPQNILHVKNRADARFFYFVDIKQFVNACFDFASEVEDAVNAAM